MITNGRQLHNARAKVSELLAQAEEHADPTDRKIYEDLAHQVQVEINEYEALASGRVQNFPIRSVDDLGAAVVKARVARGWSQTRLAEELDVTPQMVQKDEARLYEACGVARLAELLEVLGFELVGAVRNRTDVFSSRVERSSFTTSLPVLTKVSAEAVKIFSPVLAVPNVHRVESESSSSGASERRADLEEAS